MRFNISYNVRILYGTLLHVSAPWCHPQGGLRSLLKLHTIIILQNVMAKIKSAVHGSNTTTVTYTATTNSRCFYQFHQF